MKITNSLFVILMLSLPAISAEHSEMKMSDISSSASSQEYMSGMKGMHDKMMAAVKDSDPDKAYDRTMPTASRPGGGDPNLFNDGLLCRRTWLTVNQTLTDSIVWPYI